MKTSLFHRFRNNERKHSPQMTKPPVIPTSRPSSIQISSDKTSQRREAQFQDVLSAPVIDLEKIKSISWAGVPDKYRATVWRLFLDYEPVNSAIRASTLNHKRCDYFDCVERVFSESQRHLWTNAQKQTQSQIMRDLPRTHSVLLRSERVQQLFERALFVWAVRHPASGYVQGMNDLMQPFFFVFLAATHDGKIEEVENLQNLDGFTEDQLKEIEADCFWCFSKLLDGLQDLYTKDQPGLYKMLDSLSNVIDRVDPCLAKHIIDQEIQYQEFAFRWMNCLLVREFSMSIVFRLWDSYLCRHQRISTGHVFICAAMLTILSGRLINLNHTDFIIEIQSIDPKSWTVNDMEMIIAQAYVYEKMFSNSPSHLRSASMPNFNV
ncbi:TBC domain containing protein [Tritrichomonas foetus]|uniref:TBC domain containing protein n=1 Tax=Tritrichomonas foetus TaxID=1144522 RepID=A0A1J4J9Z3_9EUKA|nr:TBC domain containing protein [Tritrichomonas foetus]|eukprot:OHS96010.1 TBC domain containing protein [Tritrichomonas foetus]